jgi:hypothetical protein
MALDSTTRAHIAAHHRAEREALADRHNDQRQQLTRAENVARQREMDAARKRATGHSNARVASAEENVRNRVAKHSNLKARHDQDFRTLNTRHHKEMADAEAGKPLPAHLRPPAGSQKLSGVWSAASPQEHQQYQNIVRHYNNEHRKIHNDEQARMDRFSTTVSAVR